MLLLYFLWENNTGGSKILEAEQPQFQGQGAQWNHYYSINCYSFCHALTFTVK